MSEIIRVKGRFQKKNVYESQKKKLAALQAGRKRKMTSSTSSNSPENKSALHQERIIVELPMLAKSLVCSECNNILSLLDAVEMKVIGLHTTIKVKCRTCDVIAIVEGGKSHHSKDGSFYRDVNTKAALACLQSGMGLAAMNTMLACLNIKPISSGLFKRHEREVGPVVEEAAKESCEQAAQKEYRLLIENIDDVCERLPKDIVDVVYPPETVEKIKQIDPTNSNSAPINAAITYDMGWSTRGNGMSYDSLNGYGALIGFLSNKILDFGTRNRMCKKCSLGRKKDDHDCRLNFVGSAKAMEADLGSFLVNKSTILKNANLRVRILIGDEDSSTIAAIRRDIHERVCKLADNNHVSKNFSKELIALRAQIFTELNAPRTIKHLKKCFAHATLCDKSVFFHN